MYPPPPSTSSVLLPTPSCVAEAHLPCLSWLLHLNKLLRGIEERDREARELDQVQPLDSTASSGS